jgi:magnesium transporter
MTAEPETAMGQAHPESASAPAAGGGYHGHIWTVSGMTSRTASPTDIERVLGAEDGTSAWFFLPREETADLAAAAAHLGIDALAIEDLLGEREPIKLDWVGNSMVAVTRAVTFDRSSGELDLMAVSLLAGPRSVIVLSDESVRDDICRHLDRAEKAVLEDGVPAVLHSVLDLIVDGYTAALQQMEDEIDELSELLFGDSPLSRDQQVYAFTLRRSVARLRRATDPMRDIASGLANAAGRASDKGSGSGGRDADRAATDPAERLLGTRSVREFSDVADHADHVARGADSLRDVISSMYETNLALADVHLNTVMKKLTGWAAIIAVPTLITGFMGMNVPYPGFQSREGFLIAFAVMVAAVTTLFIMLRRKDWI